MRLYNLNSTLLILFGLLFLISCSTDNEATYEEIESLPLEVVGEIKVLINYYDNDGTHEHNFSGKRSDGFTETYESGTKGSYTDGSVNLSSSGSWFLSDALLGTLSNDRKFGSKSVRIRNAGYAIMSFNMDNGAQSISIRHAKYGNDGTSSWRLIASFDDGESWVYAGSTINTNSTTLNTVTFTVNESRSVRYGIYKTSGGSNRINIDNVEINVGSGGDSATQDSNLTFGNPSNASTSNSNNYFLSKPDFSISYNNSKGTSNWISWHLSSAWTGSTPRCNCFKRDTSLPSDFFSFYISKDILVNDYRRVRGITERNKV